MDPNMIEKIHINNNFIENLKKMIRCPISQKIMKSPVVASDGITYNSDSIERYFSTFSEDEDVKSPITRELLDNRNLIPNIDLKRMIEFIFVQGMLDLQETKEYFQENHNALFNAIKQKEVNKNLKIFDIEDKYKDPFLESITVDDKNILIKKSNDDLLLVSQIKSSNKIGISNYFDKKLNEEIKDLIENLINQEIPLCDHEKIQVVYDDNPDKIGRAHV